MNQRYRNALVSAAAAVLSAKAQAPHESWFSRAMSSPAGR